MIPRSVLERHITIYRRASDLRTRQYLQRLQTNLVEFSPEQKTKLRRLEHEMTMKDRMKPHNKKTSEDTGLPENVVAMDVIKVAMFLGIIRSKSRPPGKTSLIDMLMGKSKVYTKHKVDLSLVPYNYSPAAVVISQDERSDLLEAQRKSEEEYMSSRISKVLSEYIKQIQTQIAFGSDKVTPQTFLDEGLTFCNEAIEVICDPDESEAEKQTLVGSLSYVRSYLIAVMPISKYKGLLHGHIALLRDIGMPVSTSSMCSWDAKLLLYPYTSDDAHDAQHEAQLDAQRVFLSLQIQAYLRDPSYTPFTIGQVQNLICSESLMLCKADDVLKFTLLKLQNNNVGYLEIAGQPPLWSFYLLRDVRGDGSIRLWALDPYLYSLITNLRQILNQYMVDMFRILYHSQYGHNTYVANFLTGGYYGVYRNILNNLIYVNEPCFDDNVRSQVQRSAAIIPTEYDFFTTQRASHGDLQYSRTQTSTPLKVLTWLFREYNISDLDRLVCTLRGQRAVEPSPVK